MLPLLLLLLDYLRWSEKVPLEPWTIVKDKIPFLAVSFFYTVVHLYATSAKEGHIVNSAQSLPLFDRILNAPVVLTEYFHTGIAPFSLAGYQPYPLASFSLFESISALLLLIAAFALSFALRRNSRLLLLGLSWFVISLLPVIGILGTGESIFIGDRWTYMPHIGLFISMIALSRLVLTRFTFARLIIKPAIAIYMLALLTATNSLIGNWRDSGTYWEWTLSTTKDNHYAYNKLGEYYESVGFYDKAALNYKKAHDLHPAEYLYVLRLGNFYSVRDVDTAFTYYNKFLTSAPTPPELTFNMGIMFLVNGHAKDAENFFIHNLAQEKAQPEVSVDYFLSRLYLYHLRLRAGDKANARSHLLALLQDLPRDKEIACGFIIRELNKIETLTGFKPDQHFLNVHCPNKPS